MFHRIILIALLGVWIPAFAQSVTPDGQAVTPDGQAVTPDSQAVTPDSQAVAPDRQAVPEPPPMPEQLQSGEVMEPDVRIVRKDKSTVTEYRVNGRLRAIKVTPDGNFPAYYLYDTDGDGRLDQRRSRYEPDLLIPNWVIFSW